MDNYQFEECSGGSDESDDEFCFYESKSCSNKEKDVDNASNSNIVIGMHNIKIKNVVSNT